MSFLVDISRAPELVRITIAGGWPSAEELARMRENLVPAGHLTAATRVLVDVRDVTALPPAGELRESIEAARLAGVMPARRAYLALRGVQANLLSMAQVLASDPTVEIFTTEEEALTWLMAP
jgi:hypothetical protein